MLDGNTWINKYTLRYGVSTIYGAALLYSLKLQKNFFSFLNDWKAFVLGGFVFGFIASAPLFVIHVTRTTWRREKQVEKQWLHILKVTIPAILALVTPFVFCKYELTKSLLTTFSVIVLFFFWSLSCLCLLAFFQDNLAFARVDKITKYRGASGDFSTLKKIRTEQTETYREIRENGNAFGIILIQTLIAIVMLNHNPQNLDQNPLNFYLFALGMWITPAAITMYLGTWLELKWSGCFAIHDRDDE